MVYSDFYNTAVPVYNIVTVLVNTVILIFWVMKRQHWFIYYIPQLVMIEHDPSLVASMQAVKVFYYLISWGERAQGFKGRAWRERRKQTEGLEGVDGRKDGWRLAGAVSLISLLSLLIHPGYADRQSPKQNSLQAGVIHFPYLHGHRQHRQKQAGMRGWWGANEESLKPSPNQQNILASNYSTLLVE